MAEKVFEIVMFILATYGFVTLIHDLAVTIKNKSKYKNSMIKLVLIVKNQGDAIEGVLRNVLPRNFIRKLMPEGRLIVLDMGSKDDTLEILEKLEKDYECLEVLKKSEKDTIFNTFEEEGESRTN
ncbi:hypothetical protein RBH29_01500 [Herbivorax sp. ANBcel31]|uniref:hypothetical protein n=1 Tax=Herbivorax sp. ANBcel31 TaxID=3069754 RepID=UPI0027B52833|nr:hypothetical protein [Herbivorax sp. ANBcel31]MDQ2085111.1 hypothetical protein [Herbivorax sp. ANBcel31]